MAGAQNGRGVRRGSAQRAPLPNPCLPARAGGEPPQLENPADKGVVRPAARSARTRPRRMCSIFVLRWGTGGPLTDRRAAPGPARAGGVWLVQIPPASRSPRPARGSRYSLPARAIQPAADLGRRALQGGELDAPDAERRKASRLVERSGRGPVTARPVDHRPLLDPWGLARACCGLPPPLPRSFRREAGQPGYPPQAIVTRGAETGPLDRLLRPRAGWLGTRQAAREKPQRRGRGPGSGRRPVQPAEA